MVAKRFYKETESILFNSHIEEWRVLSNMHPCRIYYNGLQFGSSEMLYWWLRFQGEGKERQAVRNNLITQRGYWNGFRCKKIAQANKHLMDASISEWDCLLIALEAKVRCCAEFRDALFSSRGKHLVELAPWDAVKYGAVLNKQSGLIEGGNGCGRLMMLVRDRLFNGKYSEGQSDIR